MRIAGTTGTLRAGAGLTALVLMAGLVLGSLVSLTVGPRSPHLATVVTGDAQLAADFRATLASDAGYGQVSVARIRDGQVSYAGLGSEGLEPPTPQTPFELGSITKTFTGLLLADAVERGELRLDAPVSTYLPELAGSSAGAATLQQLATHTSGLPTLPPAMGLATLGQTLGNDNPYASLTVPQLLAAAVKTPVEDVGHYAYSNLGMALVGHAEARAAHAVDWPTLARTRILQPLGMTNTVFVTDAAQLPAGTADPHTDNGWRAPHWYGPAFTPAGAATVTTAEDVTAYARAVLDRRVPGLAALTPVSDATNGRIGLAWFTRETEGRALTWHNGGTGGYRSMLAVDLQAGTAVVVLNSSTRWVDRPALQLAATPAGGALAAADAPEGPSGLPLVLAATGLALLLTGLVQSLTTRSRLGLAAAALTAASGLVLLLAHGPWAQVPAWTWGGGAGLAVAATILGALRLRSAPASPTRHRVGGTLSLASAVVVLAFAVWAC
ncbi:serine hydrolase domain-containing protein [uncultured Friedmanniella sp.]|uniref:serine hydrolase domain-containing protein n=1 Tax=uncultured Friedmanniella sp. TaxID=335381 RepID=UPI0035CC4D36